MTKKNNSVNKLISIMCLLRKKCPWDKKQTLDSLISLTIEEVYDALDLQTTLQNVNEISSFLWKFSEFRQRQLHFADIFTDCCCNCGEFPIIAGSQ